MARHHLHWCPCGCGLKVEVVGHTRTGAHKVVYTYGCHVCGWSCKTKAALIKSQKEAGLA